MTSSPPIRQLAYLGISARDVPAWSAFATNYLGMQLASESATRLGFRMDEQSQRVIVEAGERDDLSFIGLEVDNEAAIATLSARLEAAAYPVQAAGPAECALRGVRAMSWFMDPDGHRLELCCGLLTAASPFTPGRPIGGFRTGALGFGHAVLQTTRYPEMRRLFVELLGFRLSDYMDAPFEASFMHVNGRHHSMALIAWNESKFHHFMVEYQYLDDVGRLYDIALQQQDRVMVTLGRHSNDHMTSFYSKTPGGFMVETGWAGRLIDEATWVPEELAGPSIWGHDRNWLPPAARQGARESLADFAARGVREPVEVVDTAGFDLRRLRA